MQSHRIASEQERLAESRAWLGKEQEFARLLDELNRERRGLPWLKVGKHSLFEGPDGRETLAGLFEGRSQLIVCHFTLEPGCPSGSFLADHFDGALSHLAQRDVTMLAVSREPLAEILAFRQRRGWRFKWVSSAGSRFDDHGASLTPAELPSVSVFYQDEWGDVFQTYSSHWSITT